MRRGRRPHCHPAPPLGTWGCPVPSRPPPSPFVSSRVCSLPLVFPVRCGLTHPPTRLQLLHRQRDHLGGRVAGGARADCTDGGAPGADDERPHPRRRLPPLRAGCEPDPDRGRALAGGL
eukprot:scaffold3128_cov121-Isochrysis_galbana.AAC.5